MDYTVRYSSMVWYGMVWYGMVWYGCNSMATSKLQQCLRSKLLCCFCSLIKKAQASKQGQRARSQRRATVFKNKRNKRETKRDILKKFVIFF